MMQGVRRAEPRWERLVESRVSHEDERHSAEEAVSDPEGVLRADRWWPHSWRAQHNTVMLHTWN